MKILWLIRARTGTQVSCGVLLLLQGAHRDSKVCDMLSDVMRDSFVWELEVKERSCVCVYVCVCMCVCVCLCGNNSEGNAWIYVKIASTPTCTLAHSQFVRQIDTHIHTTQHITHRQLHRPSKYVHASSNITTHSTSHRRQRQKRVQSH